jgi:hypothetical protein
MINSNPVSLPALFTVIAPEIISINPTSFAEIGLYKLRVEIYDF